MKLIRHGVAGLVLFSMCIGLIMSFYGGIADTYGVSAPESRMVCGVMSNVTIGEQLEDINVVESVDFIVAAFDPTQIGNPVDLVGALVLSGLGLVYLGLSVFSAPFEIAAIIECHYGLPPMFLRSLLILMCVYIAYILISAKLKKDV